MKLPGLTSSLIIGVLTFVVGASAAFAWFAYRLPTVDHLEDPNCVELTPGEVSIVKCTQSNAVGFCDLVRNPERFNHKIVRVEAMIVGFHHQHLYDPGCDSADTHSWADYDSRRATDNMMKAISVLKDGGFRRGNLWAKVVLVGRFDERPPGDLPSLFDDLNAQNHPTKDRFRFVIMNVEQAQPVASDVPWPENRSPQQ
jgi:hypothetical protein